MIEILVLFHGHGRFITIDDVHHKDEKLIQTFYKKFEEEFKDVLSKLAISLKNLLFQLYNQEYEEYVDIGKDTRFGKNNKVKVTEIPKMAIQEGTYWMWSLMSHERDGFVSSVDTGSGTWSVEARGSSASNSSKIDFKSKIIDGDEYWQLIFTERNMALEVDGNNLVLGTPNGSDKQLFVDSRYPYNGYWAFESKSENGKFIGSEGSGEMKLYDVKTTIPTYPNPAVYFIITNDVY